MTLLRRFPSIPVALLHCAVVGLVGVACSTVTRPDGDDSADSADSVSSDSGSGGTSLGGADGSSGGALSGSGGASAPVDCAPLATAGFELCESETTRCGVIFSDGSGCTAVCAAAGLGCEAAYENVDGQCAADETLPALACDSGHQSDYCRCQAGPAGTGGAPGTGGASSGGAGSGGTGSGGSPSVGADCNTVTNQPIIDVAKNGSGDFTTVQAALNSLAKSNTTPTQLRIAPGTYQEKLVVDRPYVTLCGQAGKESDTRLTFGDGASTSNGNGGTLGTSGSYSVNISASHVSVENLTIANSRGVGTQAVALLVTGNEVQFRNCRLLGNQDTLYTKSGSQYFKDCYIEGTVDFIFGGATAVFEECTVHSVSGGSAITAPNTDQAVPFGLVFLGGEVTAASSVSNGSQALGRNWGAYGAAAYLGTELGDHVSAVGWVPMGANTLTTARFSEYQTTGPGSNTSQRAADSSQLSSGEAANYTVDNILGSWTPTFSQ